MLQLPPTTPKPTVRSLSQGQASRLWQPDDHLLIILLIIASLLFPAIATAQTSLLFGAKGELWRRNGRLPPVHNVGFRGGKPIPLTQPIQRSVTSFGAQGDGFADDTEAIQAALDAKPAGVVWLPAGRYRVTAPLWIRQSGVVLRGAGAITQGSQPGKPKGSVLLACPPNATNNITPPGTTALVLIAPPSAGDLVLGDVVADAVRGDTHLMVKKLPGSLTIQAGDRLVLRMSDTATHGLRSHLEGAQATGCQTPLLVRLPILVKATTITTMNDGAPAIRLTLRQPLRQDVRQSWLATVVKAPLLHDVGAAHIRIERPSPTLPKALQAPGDGVAMSRVMDGWLVDLALHHTKRAVTLTGVRHVDVQSIGMSGGQGVTGLDVTASADTRIVGCTLTSHPEVAFLLKGPGGGLVLEQLTLARGSSQLVIGGNGLHDTVLQQMPTNFNATLTLGGTCGYALGRRFTMWGAGLRRLLPGQKGLMSHTTLATLACSTPGYSPTGPWLEKVSGPALVAAQRAAEAAKKSNFGTSSAANATDWQVQDPGRWWVGAQGGRTLWRLLPAVLPDRGSWRLREVATWKQHVGASRRINLRLRGSTGAAIVFDWLDAKNHTYASVTADHVAIIRVVKGVSQIILKKAGAWPKGVGWHQLRVTVVPSTKAGEVGLHAVTFALGSAVLATATMPLLGNRVGVGSLVGGFDVDELSVTSATCVPSCAGKSCGEDGCGGSCGACDDGNGCSVDSCSGWTCQHQERQGPCDDGNPCTTYTRCDKQACVAPSWTICNDDNPCTADSCVAGKCQHKNVSGNKCTDCQPCTMNDTCVAGVCKPGVSVCGCAQDKDCASKEDGNPCNGTLYCDTSKGLYACKVAADTLSSCETLCASGACKEAGSLTCQVATGLCSTVSGSDGQPCSDGDACTTPGTCASGSCTKGAAKSCDDQAVCTLDACKTGVGCAHVTKPGSCTDGVACTADSCVASVGCVHLPNAASCSDANPCTADTCVLSKGCKSNLTTGLCDDGDVCTTDSCTKANGCVHKHNKALCDDGNPCTAGDGCAAGVCVGKPTPCGTPDAGATDAGATDAGTKDAGATDAGAKDAGATDAGAKDAGATDAGATDAGAKDAGATDAGATDAGAKDAGAKDAGAKDAGATDAGAGSIDAGAAKIDGVSVVDSAQIDATLGDIATTTDTGQQADTSGGLDADVWDSQGVPDALAGDGVPGSDTASNKPPASKPGCTSSRTGAPSGSFGLVLLLVGLGWRRLRRDQPVGRSR